MADHEWQQITPRRSTVPIVAIAGAVALVMFGISAVVYIVSVGREATQVIGLLSAVAAPTILALIAIARGESTNATVDVVKRQTNGAMTALTNRVGEMDAKVERINKHVAVTGEHSFGTGQFQQPVDSGRGRVDPRRPPDRNGPRRQQ